jgi:hypothetical protein
MVLLLTLTASGPAAFAGNQGTFPMAFNPETAQGFTNTFTGPPTVLSPHCPNGIDATPGSFPASKVLNTVLNNGATTFNVGDQVHYTYTDNPHGTAFNFTIQDCEVVYPPGFFQTSDFNPTTGVLINPAFTKSVLDKNGTMVDGAALSGISNPEGNIYFSWTVQPADPGSWICNFARDIRDDHGGGGNRKVPPTCIQVGQPTPKPPVFVGYTDSFRPTPPNTPSIWACLPGPVCQPGVTNLNTHGVQITFIGCDIFGLPATVPPACDTSGFDGGGIRIDNPSSTQSMVISGGMVNISGPAGNCLYAPWNSSFPVTVPPNGTLVLSETGASQSGFGIVCGDTSETPNDNFDTSEANAVTNTGGSCVRETSPPVDPQISITASVGGSTPTNFSYSDTNQILNTGGIDQGACPPGAGTHEVQDWSAIP